GAWQRQGDATGKHGQAGSSGSLWWKSVASCQAWATASRVPSANGFATTWKAVGNPLAVKPHGTLSAGRPRTLNGRMNIENRIISASASASGTSGSVSA